MASKTPTFSLARYAAEILVADHGAPAMKESALREFRNGSLDPIKPIVRPCELAGVTAGRHAQYLAACELMGSATYAVFREVRFLSVNRVALLHPSGDIYTVVISPDAFPHAIAKNGLPIALKEERWNPRRSVLKWLKQHLD